MCRRVCGGAMRSIAWAGRRPRWRRKWRARNATADRRAPLVTLRARGCCVFERMAAVHKQWIDEMLGTLGDDEVVPLLRHLDRVNGSMDTNTHNQEGDFHEYERT